MAKAINTDIPGLIIIEPLVHGDQRGYFVETYTERVWEPLIGKIRFVQDNEACSSYGVLRGLHYQIEPHAQSKLVRAVDGDILDVAVDLREGSPTYGKHVAIRLTATNKRMLFVPKGFAHGYVVLSPSATVIYKCDSYYQPNAERGIVFDDPALSINWELPRANIVISPKDALLPTFAAAEKPFSFARSA